MDISVYVGSSAGSLVSSYLAAGYSLDNILNSFRDKPLDLVAPEDIHPRILPPLTYMKMLKLRSEVLGEQLGQLKQLADVGSLIKRLYDGSWEQLLQMKWLKMTGFFSTAGIEQYLREEVLPSNRFQDYQSDLFIVATQLNHSRKVVFGKYAYQPPPDDLSCQFENDVEISHASAASAALPPVYSPYAIKNKNGHKIYYIDGEVRETLSTHVAEDAGADLIFASYMQQPYHFIREVGSLTDYGLPAIVIQSLFLLVEQKINSQIHRSRASREAMDAVSEYCKEHKIGEAHRKRICNIMEEKLHHRREVDTIHIHPKATDAEIFFGENFSLSQKKLQEYVRSGFHAAIEVLSRYSFADYKAKPAVGTSESGKETLGEG